MSTPHVSAAKEELARRSRFPADMGFHPIRGTFPPGYKLKTPWLQEYWRFRTRKPAAPTETLLEQLAALGADSSVLADRFRGALMGLMLGDALGVPLEFSERDSITVTDIIGGGPFGLKAGYWTDARRLPADLIGTRPAVRSRQRAMSCIPLRRLYGPFTLMTIFARHYLLPLT